MFICNHWFHAVFTRFYDSKKPVVVISIQAIKYTLTTIYIYLYIEECIFRQHFIIQV